MDRRWRLFEKKGLGAYGRVELCGHCLLRNECFWPEQFGKSLEGSQVIFGAQAHLERSPYFLGQLTRWSEAERVLVILDEANFVMKPFRRQISPIQLQNFIHTLERMHDREEHQQWIYQTKLLMSAPTTDLRSYDWFFPYITPDWSLDVQARGYELFGESFHFIAFDLYHFCRSALESRERLNNGSIAFATVPNMVGDFIVYSGTAHQEFSQYRLGHAFASPFENYSFNHPETRWYNIASRLGAKIYFKKNSPQIFDFFAGLIALRIREGRRPLLIAKKCFAGYCAQQIEQRLRSAGLEVKVVISGWQNTQMDDPSIVPLIHYGMIGTNLFEDFDCAYCLTGYYVPEEAINSILQDLLGTDMEIPLEISIEGKPARRKAGALNIKDRSYDIHTLAQHALNHSEMDTVLQAAGRVRPYTKPREIITFQCAAHPDLEYTEEFNSLGEAREYFGIEGVRAARQAQNIEQIQNLKQQGLKQAEVAETLQLSLRTIQRYWNLKTRHQPL